MPTALNLRGVGAVIVFFGLFVGVGMLLERMEWASNGQAFAITVIGGALLCSLFAFSTDRCDSPGIFRPYWHNFQQASYEALGHVPPDYFTANPKRVTAMLAFPLALYPHVLAIAMFCFALPGIARGVPSRFDAGLWKYLPIAMIAAAFATMYGYATSGLRLVDAPPRSKQQRLGRRWFNVRNWQIVCGLLVVAISLGSLLLGRNFRESVLLGLALGIGPLSIVTAIFNPRWYFEDRSMVKYYSGAFGLKGPPAARVAVLTMGLICTAFGIALLQYPGLLTFRR